MISRLSISNYALIDSLEIEFTPGLDIITGETGAGKSIMLGALSLLLGARADTRAIRHGEHKSVVEAAFDVSAGGYEDLEAKAAEEDIEWDARECILRRELLPSGRSRAFINDSPVPAATLAEVGGRLIDIHSQHQNQLLTRPEYQLHIIDSIAGNGELAAEYSALYDAYRNATRELEETRRRMEQSRADEEYIRFRLNQLNEAQLVAGEQEELESERELQANMTRIKETLTEALEMLDESEGSALERLSRAVDATEALGEVLDEAGELAGRLESARLEIQDIAETLERYDAELGADPEGLAAIEERLGELYSLETRYRVDSVEALIGIRDGLQQQIEALEGSAWTIDTLAAEAAAALKDATAKAAELTASRRKAAGQFAAELLEAARPLGMKNLRCEVSITPLKSLGPTGADALEFRFAFNKNQEPMAAGGAASGGEMSRLMLCIKSIVARRLQLPSIVFDEVDTGVSGDVANRMGEMMKAISESIQVITITHLPQVAAMGDSHFKVYKEDGSDATHTRIRRLAEGEERERELALMLSGETDSEAALANARALLERRHNETTKRK